MNSVRDILDHKGHAVFSVTPKTNLLQALQSMREHHIGALMVLEQGRVKGIITERDFAYQVADMGVCALDQPVENWMTEEVIAIEPDTVINDCMQIMSKAHIRHLPVMEHGALIGVISIGDVVRAMINEQKSTIVGLENYILSQSYLS